MGPGGPPQQGKKKKKKQEEDQQEQLPDLPRAPTINISSQEEEAEIVIPPKRLKTRRPLLPQHQAEEAEIQQALSQDEDVLEVEVEEEQGPEPEEEEDLEASKGRRKYEKRELSESQEIVLRDWYEEHTVLYNPEDRNYRNTKYRHMLMQRQVEVMNKIMDDGP